MVGITGHRNLRPQDVPSLEDRVREVLTELQQKYPHTPLTILSPLAEGADRLVARVGLSCGARLVVPLPLPREEYKRDFATPESWTEFTELIAAADKCFDLPLVEGNTPENIKTNGQHRTAQFALVGAYLVQHCQVLLALWDGSDAEPQITGGTADVVNFRLHGTPPQFLLEQNPLDAPDVGPVIHIVTPRSTHSLPTDELFARRDLYPDGYDIKYFEDIYERVETFNRNAVQPGHQFQPNTSR
jgi:hypothetical protein